jgi:hypothetical protein
MLPDQKLLAMLTSSVPQIRIIAIEQIRLNKDNSPAIINALEKATLDEDPDVAEKARQALQNGMDQPPALPPDALPTMSTNGENNPTGSSGEPGNRCSYCHSDNPTGALFCNYCGQVLPSADPKVVMAIQSTRYSAISGAPPVKKSHKVLYIILGVFASFAVLAIIFFTLKYRTVNAESQPIQSVLHTFMTHLVARDVDSAYALTSPPFQEYIPKTRLSDIFLGDNYFLIEGYQSLTIQKIKITNGPPQIAEVTAMITFNTTQGTLTASLMKVDGQWMINEVNVNRNLAP